ncbi:putative acetyltransferase (plasmid) [Phaeobacter inhibens]|uniref:Acetyltransferase n=1 Tax=Phaeobacter inhibens TaxID=221822 RepID=A0ABM6RKC0_9RHOB|nr:GNAT family N-acetyltransferase [Phaeobacter inhibens]AUQ52399.1 putative acetyltransferase [Phaeobacter inhibens]AUQ97004.1 putative acetyltransferase [Phaeobacter inhibens]AUR06039.1 putative acetyltransferase [Phaeobacter inhibens]AUR22204.1 putative acetyltransferase [Phaeobacter inhibens]UWR54913.1 GNAT family N-acetyltransferase [Phaeobacter inhibens]
MNTIRPSPSFQVEPGFRPEHRKSVAHGYWRAFSRKLRYPLGPQAKAIDFLERVMNPSHAISAVSQDGAFLGVAGFKTPDSAFVAGDYGDLLATYGWVSAALRGLLIGVLDRDCTPGTLLMDGIFVEPNARGQGIGKILLREVEKRARSMQLLRVRLDVIDSNPRARALYEREGFIEQSVTSLGPLNLLFGFSSATEMVKSI